MSRSRIFVSYKRDAAHDQPLADRLQAELSRHGHRVFIDRSMEVGEDWVKRIQHEVETLVADCAPSHCALDGQFNAKHPGSGHSRRQPGALETTLSDDVLSALVLGAR